MEADIRINAAQFTYYLDTPSSPLSVHLESLMIHEFGHVLGLGHSGDNPSQIMGTSLLPAVERTDLGEQERSALSCEY